MTRCDEPTREGHEPAREGHEPTREGHESASEGHESASEGRREGNHKMNWEPSDNSVETQADGRLPDNDRVDLIHADHELAAMKTVLEVLAPLPQVVRNRVLSWVEQRLAPVPGKPTETAEERRHRLAVEQGQRSWQLRKKKETPKL